MYNPSKGFTITTTLLVAVGTVFTALVSLEPFLNPLELKSTARKQYAEIKKLYTFHDQRISNLEKRQEAIHRNTQLILQLSLRKSLDNIHMQLKMDSRNMPATYKSTLIQSCQEKTIKLQEIETSMGVTSIKESCVY